MVEPQVDVFERELTKTYRGKSRVIRANVAIAASEGSMPSYRIALSDSRWATGLSGFRRSSIEQHLDDGHIRRKLEAEGKQFPDSIEDLVRADHVAAMMISTLLDRHQIEKVDVLCIDTEVMITRS